MSYIIKNIIWDVGGTLFDTYPAMTAAFLSALAEHGIQAPAGWVRALAQISQKHCAHTLASTYHLDEETFWQRYRQFLKDAPPGEQLPFPGVRSVCRRVRRGGGLNLIATHRARESVEQLLRAHRLAALFSGCLTTSDGYPRKPDPAMLEVLVSQYGLERASTLAVGDRELDIQAGKAAGLVTCLFGSDGGETLPDLRIQRYAELLPLIR